MSTKTENPIEERTRYGAGMLANVQSFTDKYFSFRRLEIQRGHLKETMWLTIRQSIIHILTLIIFTFIMLDLSSQNYYTVEAFEKAFTTGEFYFRPRKDHPEPRVPVRLTMVNVTNTISFWDYITTQFIRLYTSQGNKPAILEVNHFLGVARIRQLRVNGDSCILEKVLRDHISQCYGFFRIADEDKNPFGPGTPSAWVYSPPEVTGYSSYSGLFGVYDGGGYFVDLPRDYASAMGIVDELKEKNWISRQTRYVFVHACVYNSNTNDFWIIQLNFEFAPVGRILPSLRVYRLRTIDAQDPSSYFLTACRVYLLARTIWGTIAQILLMVQFGRTYMLMMGHYVELTCLLSSWLFIGFDSIYWYSVTPFRQMGPNHHYCATLQKAREHLDVILITGSIALFLLVVSSLELLDFGGSSALALTLLSSLFDILSFSIVFLLTLFVFSVASYILFGQYVESMRGLPHSFFTLFNAVLRSFDYHTLLEASRTFAPIFFILFTFLIVFLLCNLFVVILNDTYFDVRTKGIGSTSLYNFPSFVAHGFSNIARKMHIPLFGKKSTPPGLPYQCVRSLFHNAWVHWPEMHAFFNRPRVREAAGKNRIDEICVADVPRLKFGYLKEAYWEDFERLLLRMSIIKKNIYEADSFIAPLVSKDAPRRIRSEIVEENDEHRRRSDRDTKDEQRRIPY